MIKALPYDIWVQRVSPSTILVSDNAGQLAMLANMSLLEAKNTVRMACAKHDCSNYIMELRMGGIIGNDEPCRTWLRHELLNF